VHLAKLNSIDFDSNHREYEYNTLRSKISDECEAFIQFEVKFYFILVK